MCGGPLRRATYADDVLECPVDGPVIYVGRGAERDVAVEVVYPTDDEADHLSIDEALRAARRPLAELLLAALQRVK